MKSFQDSCALLPTFHPSLPLTPLSFGFLSKFHTMATIIPVYIYPCTRYKLRSAYGGEHAGFPLLNVFFKSANCFNFTPVLYSFSTCSIFPSSIHQLVDVWAGSTSYCSLVIGPLGLSFFQEILCCGWGQASHRALEPEEGLVPSCWRCGHG